MRDLSDQLTLLKMLKVTLMLSLLWECLLLPRFLKMVKLLKLGVLRNLMEVKDLVTLEYSTSLLPTRLSPTEVSVGLS